LKRKDLGGREFPLTGRHVNLATTNGSAETCRDADTDNVDTAGAAVEIPRSGGHMGYAFVVALRAAALVAAKFLAESGA
jgi:hypothetical protein